MMVMQTTTTLTSPADDDEVVELALGPTITSCNELVRRFTFKQEWSQQPRKSYFKSKSIDHGLKIKKKKGIYLF